MKILFYSIKNFELAYIQKAAIPGLIIELTEKTLSLQTADLAKGFDAVSIFTGDDASAGIIELLHKNSVNFIVIRAAGYDNTDIKKAAQLGIKVANVPEYSPHAIAEHTVAIILALDRKLILANRQVHEHNFTIDNLVGFNLHRKNVGIIGTGRIGQVVTKILHGFGCNLFAFDICPNHELENKYGVTYTGLENLCRISDIITIHTPLNEQTKNLINDKLITTMKRGVMIINTARGAVVNTTDIIANLQSGQIGYYGMDVYEKEKAVFFYDHSGKQLTDKQLLQLLNMPNVLLTPHQAFATAEALQNIAVTTFHNLDCWNKNKISENELTVHANSC